MKQSYTKSYLHISYPKRFRKCINRGSYSVGNKRGSSFISCKFKNSANPRNPSELISDSEAQHFRKAGKV